MADCMRHRGPDGDGLWSDPKGRAVLAQKRLAIIDTSDAGLQPFVSSDGRWWLTFNGEIYNFQQLRSALEAQGVHLRGRTDTEVLLEGIALFGAEWITRLDGMFAFAAFDTLTGETLLARDPFGEKPLYTMELEGRGLAFASELQAMEKVPGFDGTVDLDAAAEMLTFQYVGAPRTIYASVRKLPPGCWMRISAEGEVEIQRYYRFDPGHDRFENRSISSMADELEDILVRSLKGRLISDVPLGAFLSGGVDSSTVCALIRRSLDRPLKTFSIGFDGAAESEHNTARLFAKHLGTEHHEEIVAPNSADFLLGIGALQDEPNGDSSCLPTYLLSRFCREHVTVALSGDGGDEMFGGYGRYFAGLQEQERHARGQLPGWKPGNIYYGSRILVANEALLNELFGFVPEGFESFLGSLRADMNEVRPSLLAAMRRHDVEHYMPGAVIPKVDRMSMRQSLEVRTPFLNVELANFAAKLPDDAMVQGERGKLVLKEIAYRYLPRELIDLPKQGFALPMSDWGRNALLDAASQMLEADDSRLAAGFGREGVSRFLARQRSEGHFSAYQLWGVAALESWLRHHPARLPDVSARMTRSRAAGRAAVSNLHQLREGLFALSKLTEEELSEQVNVPTVLPPRIVDYAFAEAREHAPLEGVPRVQAFIALEAPLSDADVQRLSGLKGATLVLLDGDDIPRLDAHSIDRLRVLGVTRLAFADPRFSDVVTEISMRAPGRAQAGRLASLWFKRVGVFSNRRAARWLASSQPIRFREHRRLDSGPIAAVRPVRDRELSDEYALFEADRQLPPLHCSHDEITQRGRGRYSVYNQYLIYSATQEGQQYRAPYWLVPVTKATRPLLDMVRRSIPAADLAVQPAEVIAPLFRPGDGDGFSLQLGDHIALCTKALPPGGAERQWVYLAQGLKDLGYRVTVVTCDTLDGAKGHYLSTLAASDIPHFNSGHVSMLWMLRSAKDPRRVRDLKASFGVHPPESFLNAWHALAAVAPKAVIAQLDEPNAVFTVAARALGIKRIVASFRNYNPTNFPYLDKDWFKPAYQLAAGSGAARFTSNFRGSADNYADWIGIDRGRVVTIPNAIDATQFRPVTDAARTTLRARLGIGEGCSVVLGVFRLEAEKSPADFLQVAKRVSERHKDVMFFIVGVGPMEEELHALVVELGLKDVVRFLGRRDDVPALMNAADLFLLTSKFEGMSNVLLEAQFCGLPVVATDAGAAREVIEEGVTGYVCSIGAVEELAARCLHELEGKQIRKYLFTARERLEGKHSKLALAQAYVDVLKT